MKLNLTDPSIVRTYMSEATSENDWSARCAEVKRDNGGDYPEWWYATIMLSGVASATVARWQR